MSLRRYIQDKLGDPSATSSDNSSDVSLNAGATFTGVGEAVWQYPSVVVACKTDQNGTLYIEFSPDNTNWDSSLSFLVTAGTNEVHRITVTRPYYRVRFTNTSGGSQTYFRLTTLFGSQTPLTSALNAPIQSDSDAIPVKSILLGETDGGHFKYVPVDTNGHLEVALHSPRLPFGSIHTESLTPVFQMDAVYGINGGQFQPSTTSGSGTVTDTGSLWSVSTGTTIYSQASLLGRKRLRYRAGQGVVGRFTALYTAPIAYSYALAGYGTASDGVYFGYGDTNDLTNTEFGILYVRGGVREVKTLTVTTGATSSGNVTVTLNGTAFTIAVTNASNIQRTVWEISQGTYTGWKAYPSGATVVFIRDSAGTTAGTQSFSAGATGSAASIAQTKAGVASTDTFISQSDWNGDKMDGTGASGVTANWEKGNVFQIGIQYLGFGAITFQVESAPNGNNAEWITVHTLSLPNTLTSPSFTNPSFPFTMAAYSAGSTTNVGVKSASVAGFIEGAKALQGGRFTYFNSLTTVGATNFQALFTIMNQRYYKGKANQSVINLLNASGALKHTSPCIFYLIKGGSLSGNPNFQALSADSCSVYDTAATTVTYSTGDQLLATFHLGDTGDFDHHFGNGSFNMEELTLQPGEWVTLAVKATTGTPAYVTGTINTREDQ